MYRFVALIKAKGGGLEWRSKNDVKLRYVMNVLYNPVPTTTNTPHMIYERHLCTVVPCRSGSSSSAGGAPIPFVGAGITGD